MENITDNQNFKNWFKDSKAVNSDGSPMVLYHQTNKENEESIKDLGFEHGRGRAILSDNGVPNGFFFKPSDADIGLSRDTTQIPVYLSLQNPLVVNNRRELLLTVSEIDTNVYEADYQFYLKDKEYNKRFDSLHKEISASRETYKSRHNELDVILKEWGDWVKSAASEMRELMTNALIKSNYDGVILKNDAGSFNRSVTTYIAFYPEQIKSIHNNGEFNPNEKSIMKEKELNEQISRMKTMMNIMGEASDPSYLSWKRKNVTIRGVKEAGEENNAGAMLGRGLYTAFLSNKSLAKQYGTVYFVVNAIPKNPKVFNTLNEWEIWFYNTLVYQYSKEQNKDYPDRRDFNANTTIEDEMQKMGYDGIIIKGREMVNFKPDDNILYFKTEDQLKNYYDIVVNK